MATKEKIVEEVVDNIDKAAEIVTEAVELVEAPYAWVCRLSRRQHLAQLIGVGAVVGAVVAVAAYKIAEKRLVTKYDAILEEEIQKAKALRRHLDKTDYTSPEEAAEKLLDPETKAALKEYQGGGDEGESETVSITAETVNIFRDKEAPDTFDLEEERKARSPLKPYIISEDEFLENEPEHEQEQLTYYEGDGILADDEDTPIPDVDRVIGEDHLQRFGHGSGDSKILFIRNERMNKDFEVAKSDGKFSHEVAGLEHSDGPGVQRIRSRSQDRE